MAKDTKTSGPQPGVQPVPGTPAGTNDFSALVASALDNIITTAPDGTTAPVNAVSGPHAPPNLPPVGDSVGPLNSDMQHVPQAQRHPAPVVQRTVNPFEDHATASYQAMLRQEEAILAQRPQRPDPPMPPALALVYGVPTGADIVNGEVRYKEDANPLLVECHRFLVAGVAGRMITPYGSFYEQSKGLLERLGAEVVAVRTAVLVESK